MFPILWDKNYSSYHSISIIRNKAKLLFSHSTMSNSLQPHGLQHARLPCPSPSPGACSNSCPLSPWCHPTTLSSVIRFSFCLSIFPSIRVFLMSQLFSRGGQNIGVSASATIPPMIIQDWFLYDWMVGSPCSPRNSQESSLTPQFKNINSLALCLLYGPTFTSIHDYWKNHSFNYTDLSWQSNVSAF